MGAIIARVVALACQAGRALDGTAIKSYKKFFYYLGGLGPTEDMLYHATSHLSRWGGFDVEIDHYVEKQDAEYSIYEQLMKQQQNLGCKKLLDWQATWKYGLRTDRIQHVHKSGKFDDYTNFLLRRDTGCSIRPTNRQKLEEHKGDFAGYMEKRFDGQSDQDIFNPGPASQQSHVVSTPKLPVSNQEGAYYVKNRRNAKTQFPHLQMYRKEHSRKEKQEFFNPYHDFDQLDHISIEKAIGGYATGSTMFWTLFALASMCSVEDPFAGVNDLTEDDLVVAQNKVRIELETRADLWRAKGDHGLLPITKDSMFIVEQLAEEFIAARVNRGFVKESFDILDAEALRDAEWWVAWREKKDAPNFHVIPFVHEAEARKQQQEKSWEDKWVPPLNYADTARVIPTTPTIPSEETVPQQRKPNRAVQIDETPLEPTSDSELEAPVPGGRISWSEKIRKASGQSNTEPAPGEEAAQPQIDWGNRGNGRVPWGAQTMASSRLTQPGRVNCTTPMAAAAEHREAMRNQFYL
jgi:hypothetical protein